MSAVSPFSLFGTDHKMEKEGIIVDYGAFKFRIARAGGANSDYLRVLRAKYRPYRHRFQTDTISEEVTKKILAEVYAEAVILGWSGVCDEDGKEIEFTKENCVELLLALPDLFEDLQAQATDYKLFRQKELETEAKN